MVDCWLPLQNPIAPPIEDEVLYEATRTVLLEYNQLIVLISKCALNHVEHIICRSVACGTCQ